MVGIEKIEKDGREKERMARTPAIIARYRYSRQVKIDLTPIFSPSNSIFTKLERASRLRNTRGSHDYSRIFETRNSISWQRRRRRAYAREVTLVYSNNTIPIPRFRVAAVLQKCAFFGTILIPQ